MKGVLGVAHILCAASSAGVTVPPPLGLRTEHAPSPVLGVDPEQPVRLSWRLPPPTSEAQRGVRCTGYEIEGFAHAPVVGGAGAPGTLVWSTGLVATPTVLSAVSTLWAGGSAVLRGEQLYSWRVRWHSSDERTGSSTAAPSAWSEPGWFVCAPTQATWRKETSWLNGSLGMLRRDFTLPKAAGVHVAHATLFASTIGFHELYLNGELLGDQQRYLYEPGQSAYYYRALVTTINVTSQVRAQQHQAGAAAAAGNGTLGAQLGNGPCSILGKSAQEHAASGEETTVTSPDCHDYGSITMLCCKRGKKEARAFRAILSVTMSDGIIYRVTTTANGWQTATGPVKQDDLYMGEVYDARYERPGFFQPGYDSSIDGGQSPVQPAHVIVAQPSGQGANANPNARMSTQLMPDIAVTRSFKPVKVSRISKGVAVFEFPRYMSGRCTLRILPEQAVVAGTRITLIHSPVLDRKSGRVVKQFTKYLSGGNA